MLVLSRKAGEEIVMSNGAITISVLGITGKKVRLGVSAPSGIPVHRKEIQHRITQATKPEADSKGDSLGTLQQFAEPAQSDTQSNTVAAPDLTHVRRGGP
jgi:carbon storage regulator